MFPTYTIVNTYCMDRVLCVRPALNILQIHGGYYYLIP